MSDFRGYLQKTLLGTHGQEIMNDTKGTDQVEYKKKRIFGNKTKFENEKEAFSKKKSKNFGNLKTI